MNSRGTSGVRLALASPSFLIVVGLASSELLLADECKLWDFEKPKNAMASAGAAMDLISWSGGSEQQCRRLRDSIASRLRKYSEESRAEAAAARKRAEQAVQEWLHAPEPQRDAAGKTKDAAAKHAETVANQSRKADGDYLDFTIGLGHPCTCIRRGETELERKEKVELAERQAKHEAERKEHESKRLELEQQREAAREAEEAARERAAQAKTAAEKQAAEEDVKQAAERQLQTQAAIQQQAAYAAEANRQANVAGNQTSRSRGSRSNGPGGDPGAAQNTARQVGEVLAGGQILATLPEPFGDKPGPPPQTGDGGLRLPEPFPEGPSIHSPGDTPIKAPNLQEEKESEQQFQIAKTAAEKLIKKGEEWLSEGVDQAPKVMSGNPKGLKSYMVEAEDTRSLLSGLGKFVQYGSYTAKAMDAGTAETNTKRMEAIGDLGFDIAKDIASYGLDKYATTVFGRRIGAALLGPVGWGAGIVAEVLRPEQITADPEEVIHNTSGKYSIKEKQEAIASVWREFDKHGDSWSAAQKKQLQDMTHIVFEEAKTK